MSKPHLPQNFPQLTTRRLLLRPLALQDAAAVYRNFSDPQVVKYFMEEPLHSLADAEALVRELVSLFEVGEGMFWALTIKESQEMIGTCSFERFSEDRRGEVGFDLAHDWWGQGLMAEALRAIMDYGFEVLKLKAVYAITDPGNYRALRLLKRLGFLLEGEKDRALCLLLKRRAWKLFHT